MYPSFINYPTFDEQLQSMKADNSAAAVFHEGDMCLNFFPDQQKVAVFWVKEFLLWR